MKRKLLLRAAEILSKIPKKQFDLDTWVDGDAEECIMQDKKVTKKARCGTVACAGGWLGITKEFNDLGLKFEKRHGFLYAVPELSYTKNGETVTDSFEALGKVFDLSYEQVESLFTSSGHGEFDDDIIEKHGDISDRELFQYRVKKVINQSKKSRKARFGN